MDLFAKIRQKKGLKKLLKKASETKRKVSYSRFNNVKSIGFVWDTINPSELSHIISFHSKMQSRGIDVNVIGYYKDEKLPADYTAYSYFTCLKRSDLNFFFIPICSEAESFLAKEYDVLIDANFADIFPLRYITTLAKAGLKVGLYDEKETDLFDIMIERQKPSLSDYIEQVTYYLEMINNEKQQ